MMYKLLLNRAIYLELVQTHLPRADRFLWIVTADIKNLHVEEQGHFVPLLKILSDLVEKGVAVRLIHAREPGPRFREAFDHYTSLHDNELFERILCPRVHTKAIVIDGNLAFVGSANLTGAGLGSKHQDTRNFEAGLLVDDKAIISELMSWIDNLYLGNFCSTCNKRQYCPDPIDSVIG